MDLAAANKGLAARQKKSRSRGTIHARYDSWRHLHAMDEYEHKTDREVMFRDWSTTRIQSWWRMQIVRWRYSYDRFTYHHIAASVVQRAWHDRIAYLEAMGLGSEHSRRMSLQQQQHQHQHQHQQLSQSSQLSHSSTFAAPPPKRKPGAHSIQGAWRRYTSRRIFQYYRDLIRFRNAGNPALMLRSINPREASLFDEAAGIVLRFRLGGESFPPLIYYKIFTRSPLCDVNAFAPRDYVRSKQYQTSLKANNWGKKEKDTSMQPGGLGNKTKTMRRGGDGRTRVKKMTKRGTRGGSIRVGRSQFSTKYADDEDDYGSSRSSMMNVEGGGKSGEGEEQLFAYVRNENNGWRSVTLEVLTDADEDPTKRKIKNMHQRFHYSRQVRKEDKMIEKKQKKRKWMMKMYQEGLAKERPEVLAAAAGRGDHGSMLSRLEVDFEGDHWEEEAENLLEWSETLDFDSYLNDWTQIGTSTNQKSQVKAMIDDMSRSTLYEDSEMM